MVAIHRSWGVDLWCVGSGELCDSYEDATAGKVCRGHLSVKLE